MNDSTKVGTEIAVRPLRFTDHQPRMQEFLSLLGYSTRVSRAESWVTMVGGSGQVALHDAAISGSQSGETGLMFEVPDADALATQLAEAGFGGVEIYDEAWGRVLRVQDDDTQLSFDERPTDYYGYHLDEPRPEHGIVSMPLLYGPPTGYSIACCQRPGSYDSTRATTSPGAFGVAPAAVSLPCTRRLMTRPEEKCSWASARVSPCQNWPVDSPPPATQASGCRTNTAAS